MRASDTTRRCRAMAPRRVPALATTAVAAGEEGDNDANEGDDAVDDGGQDVADARDDCHDAVADGTEEVLDLYDIVSFLI